MEVKVLVTGIGGGGVGQQIIKALRYAKNDYVIYGTDITSISKGFNTVDYPFVVPRANDGDYIITIIKICKKHGVKAIFPGSEVEIDMFNINREIFQENNILVFINSEEVLDICMDKEKTISFLERHSFCFPKTFSISSVSDIETVNIFPLVLKPSQGAGGSMNVLIAQNKNELKLFSIFLLKIYSKFIAQEYVGTPDEEFTVGVLFDQEGSYINTIALRRDLSGGLNCRLRIPNTSSKKELGENLVISSGISQGEFGDFRSVIDQCNEIAIKLKPNSAINLQCRLVNDKVYLFEINPRFSGTTSLRAMVGFNEPDLLIRKHILNEPIKSNFSFQYAKVVRGLDEVVFYNESDVL